MIPYQDISPIYPIQIYAEIKILRQNQLSLGQNAILFGYFHKSWENIQRKYHTYYFIKPLSNNIVSSLVTLCHDIIQAKWAHRIETIHNSTTNPSTQLDSLQNTLRKLYLHRTPIHQSQTYLYSTFTSEEIPKLPLNTLKTHINAIKNP